ncbi:uncharacterized protein L3040_008551 [Drepanopeziza brunnea f. sp. 'multigermtubi']|uniref:uncharacterized protein n=1 Tax=Drepanopeziza brunnea f. sp. 'multigermtubi' TaxID=698441 RepID=UPI002398716D|nr:hypothetical protein L3040_008551 [Drepanopeziza brunnea f. sp. 'multigermtubi']
MSLTQNKGELTLERSRLSPVPVPVVSVTAVRSPPVICQTDPLEIPTPEPPRPSRSVVASMQATDVLRTATVVATVLAISLLAPLMIARAWIRGFVVGVWAKEDWTCIFAWIFTTAYCVTGFLMTKHGGGVPQSQVSASELITFKKLLYVDTIIYCPSAFFTKITLLLIFTRAFAHFRKTVISIYVLIGVLACYYLPVLFLKLRLCTPIEGLWDTSVDAVCWDKQRVFFVDAVVSCVTDGVVLILPVPLVWSLNVPLVKKLRIAALLGAGGIATIASVFRALLVFSPEVPENITVDFVQMTLLGIVEVFTALICACLPTLNLLFTRYTLGKQSCSHASSMNSAGPPKQKSVASPPSSQAAMGVPPPGSGLPTCRLKKLRLQAGGEVGGWKEGGYGYLERGNGESGRCARITGQRRLRVIGGGRVLARGRADERRAVAAAEVEGGLVSNFDPEIGSPSYRGWSNHEMGHLAIGLEGLREGGGDAMRNGRDGGVAEEWPLKTGGFVMMPRPVAVPVAVGVGVGRV